MHRYRRPLLSYLALLVVVLLVAVSVLADEEQQQQHKASKKELDCEELGFGATLVCSTCQRLAELLSPSDQLVKECKLCCTADKKHDRPKLYDSARIVVCQFQLERQPGLNTFLSTDIKSYANVHFLFVRGAMPTIQLFNGNELASQTSIDGWNENEIKEYIQHTVKRRTKDGAK